MPIFRSIPNPISLRCQARPPAEGALSHLIASIQDLANCYDLQGMGENAPAPKAHGSDVARCWAIMLRAMDRAQDSLPETLDPAYWEREPANPNAWRCKLQPGDKLRIKNTGELATFKRLIDGMGTSPNISPVLITLDTGPYMGDEVKEHLDNLERV